MVVAQGIIDHSKSMLHNVHIDLILLAAFTLDTFVLSNSQLHLPVHKEEFDTIA